MRIQAVAFVAGFIGTTVLTGSTGASTGERFEPRQEEARLETSIRVRDESSGCYHHAQREDEWFLDGQTYRCGSRSLGASQLASIRSTVLAAPEQVDDLLRTVGVTPERVAARRDEILAASLPHTWHERGAPRHLSLELEALLTHDSLAPHIEREVLGQNWTSTSSLLFEVTLPGDPPITVRSQGLAEWMLPWTITAGERTWTSPDVHVSHALLALADPAGPCHDTLDGTGYWTDSFYSSETFWRRFVGTKLDAALSKERYVKLPGFESVTRRFEIEGVSTGSINLLPESMCFELKARYPNLIDAASWFNLLEDGETTSTWEDFERAISAVQAAAQRHPWIAEWKFAGPQRSVHASIVGDRGHAEHLVDTLVTPAWKHAGFEGEPEIRLSLAHPGRGGTIWLSSRSPKALIVRAGRESENWSGHWFDELYISFHPKTPTYALVDENGVVETRTVGRDETRRPR